MPGRQLKKPRLSESSLPLDRSSSQDGDVVVTREARQARFGSHVMMDVATLDDPRQMMQAEFREMPELRLTVSQAARLWNLTTFVAKSLLDALADAGLLERTPEGRYLRVGRG